VAGRSAARIALPRGLLVVTRILGACLAYLAVLDITVLLAYAVGQTLVPDPARGTFGLLALGVAEAAALGVVLLVWRLVDRRRIADMGLDATQAPRQRWLKGALIAVVMMGFVVLVGYTLIDGATWDVNSDPLRAVLALVGGFAGFAIQGPAEEVLFRGYILENVRRQWGLPHALIVSSLTFSLLHLSNPAFGVLPFINLVLFGLGTALYRVYVDADQLWGVFALHTMWNWLQQVVFGLPNSGIASAPEYSLFSISPNTTLPGPFWGGGFGPEGTLAASLVLLAVIGGSVRARLAQPRPEREPPTQPQVAASAPGARSRKQSGRRLRGRGQV
jgi:CAAX protease family protein